MSLCDTCPTPGACCKGLSLSTERGSMTFWADVPRLEVLAYMAQLGLPFIPGEISGRWTTEEGREYVTYRYDCPMLGEDGRCTIYADRPDLCRRYEPKSDRLCVLYEGDTHD